MRGHAQANTTDEENVKERDADEALAAGRSDQEIKEAQMCA